MKFENLKTTITGLIGALGLGGVSFSLAHVDAHAAQSAALAAVAVFLKGLFSKDA